jgi:release factor glutamine methyltransferase
LYLPSDDTFLLAESVKCYKGKSALEIGVGSGTILKVLRENYKIVVGTDLDIGSLLYCNENLSNDLMLACCDAASAFKYRFDLIVFNPPYLPDDDNEKMDSAIHGGPCGVETALHFINSAISLLGDAGKMLILISSLSHSTKLDKLILQNKLKSREIREAKLFFETLTVFEISFK